MARTFTAVFENGVLRPLEPLDLHESQRVSITFPIRLKIFLTTCSISTPARIPGFIARTEFPRTATRR
ncbi:MAG: antitoxin family protein [Bryobacterales bacterium]|nr:antitoxin family protein [Bryobacterales bacterium]